MGFGRPVFGSAQNPGRSPLAVDAYTINKCRTIRGLRPIHSHRSPPGVKEPDSERLAADVRNVNAERAQDRTGSPSLSVPFRSCPLIGHRGRGGQRLDRPGGCV